MTALNDGGFVVTWMSNNQDGSDWGIYGQRYAADGAPSGNEFLINNHTQYSQYEPSVTALADGGFVVAWQSDYQDEYPESWNSGIYARRYESGTQLVDGDRIIGGVRSR